MIHVNDCEKLPDSRDKKHTLLKLIAALWAKLTR